MPPGNQVFSGTSVRLIRDWISVSQASSISYWYFHYCETFVISSVVSLKACNNQYETVLNDLGDGPCVPSGCGTLCSRYNCRCYRCAALNLCRRLPLLVDLSYSTNYNSVLYGPRLSDDSGSHGDTCRVWSCHIIDATTNWLSIAGCHQPILNQRLAFKWIPSGNGAIVCFRNTSLTKINRIWKFVI